MNPGELIYFFLIGVALVVAISIFWFIFRKRIKVASTVTFILVIGYVGYILYYPTLKITTHTERYEKITEYLAENYPNKKFTISPEYYEEGYTVGDFQVNDRETPTIGVTLRVNKEEQVTQIGTWSNLEYPTQQELWREIDFTYGEMYTLDRKSTNITKKDDWMDGELTAFALTIDGMPAIALFNYSKEGIAYWNYEKESVKVTYVLKKRVMYLSM